jgi:hypothetical protein
MYRCSIANASVSGTFTFNFRDENTNLPIKWSNRPVIWLTDGDSHSYGLTTVLPGDPQPYRYELAHQPSFAYSAYIFSGDFYFVEAAQFQAQINWGGWSYAQREGVAGIWWNWIAPRAVAWCMRTLAQTICITPDVDEGNLRTDYVNSFNANVQRIADIYLDGVMTADPKWGRDTSWNAHKNKLGWVFSAGGASPYGGEPGYPTNYFVDAPWMQNWVGMALAHADDMQLPGVDAAKLDRVMRWSLAGAVARCGDDTAWPYTMAFRYTMTVMKDPAGGRPNSPPASNSYIAPDWATAYAWDRERYAGYPNQSPLAPGAPFVDLSGYPPNVGMSDPGIWSSYINTPSFAIAHSAGAMMGAISAAVDKNLPGAAEAWARLASASNWGANVAFYHDRPLWGITPRTL